MLHGFVLQCCLEWTEQRRNLIVGLQHLEDGLVTLIEERKDMRHITILSEPVVFIRVGIEEIAVLVKYSACRFLSTCLLVHDLFSSQHIAVLVVWLALIVHKEIDTGGKEIDC